MNDNNENSSNAPVMLVFPLTQSVQPGYSFPTLLFTGTHHHWNTMSSSAQTQPKFPTSSDPNNSSYILQPKRLNVPVPQPQRSILGHKGQLLCLSNQQLTTLLVRKGQQGPTSTNEGPIIPSGTTTGGGGGGSRRAPTTMAKRNARERNRVKQVNQGFQTLRQHIPDSYRMKKMSKVDTLKCALDYIRSLERILQDPTEGGGEEEDMNNMNVNVALDGNNTNGSFNNQGQNNKGFSSFSASTNTSSSYLEEDEEDLSISSSSFGEENQVVNDENQQHQHQHMDEDMMIIVKCEEDQHEKQETRNNNGNGNTADMLVGF